LDAGYAILVEAITSRGVPLVEALKDTENLRARRPDQPEPEKAVPGVAPPPNMAALSELAAWNEMK